MSKFSFRLQRVLEVRQAEEEDAKNLYLEAQASRIEGEKAIQMVIDHRNDILRQPVQSLEEHRQLEAYLEKCDEAERQGRIALQVLVDEEAGAETRWHERHRDVEALLKLRTKALDEWTAEQARREQAELDEWTTMRRVA